jgi:hypothetical protein
VMCVGWEGGGGGALASGSAIDSMYDTQNTSPRLSL